MDYRTLRNIVAASAGAIVFWATAPAFSVSDGAYIGQLSIPKIGVNERILEGTTSRQLNAGVGHYKNTHLPGQGSVIAIAGHRTTYHRPFYNLNLLKAGDPITIRMGKRTYRYKVTGTRVVAWNDWSILRSWGAEKLVLTACHPRGYAYQRIVAFAKRI